MDRRKRIVYPRTMDTQTVYLQNVITKPNIEVGAYTMYHDVVHDPRGFETNNVLYQYPVNEDKLKIGKFCSIACGAKFLFTSANHTLRSLSTYPFPIFFEQWGLDGWDIRSAWDNRGDIVVGNDVWIGFEAVILSGLAASSMQAPYPSPRRKRQVSSISLHLLFRPNPLRWASVEFLRRTLAQRPVFGLLAGTPLGCVRKAAQTADTGATGCNWHFGCALNLCFQQNRHISSSRRSHPVSAAVGHSPAGVPPESVGW